MQPESLDLAQIRQDLQQAGSPWEMDETSMTTMSQAERVRRLGVTPPPGETTLEELDQALRSGALHVEHQSAESVGAPASFDLRNVGGANYVTPIRDQGGCGSCVAFGTCGALESTAAYERRDPSIKFDLSEAQLFYCYARGEGRTCANGWWPENAFKNIQAKGLTFEDYYPYTAGDQDCTGLNADWPNRLAKVTAWTSLTGDAAAMKQNISSYGSVTACLDVYQDFFSYRTGIYRHVTGAYAGGHCITLIGYDDSAGCWIGKNSWNTGWGDAGFLRIAYGECRIETYQACGPTGVSLRAWLPNQQISGLWSNEYDANVWAYGSLRGWLKLDGSSTVTASAMLADLAAAKAGNRQVGLFEDDGVVKQIYAW